MGEEKRIEILDCPAPQWLQDAEKAGATQKLTKRGSETRSFELGRASGELNKAAVGPMVGVDLLSGIIIVDEKEYLVIIMSKSDYDYHGYTLHVHTKTHETGEWHPGA